MSPCDRITHWVEAALKSEPRRPRPAPGHPDRLRLVVHLTRSSLLVACVVHLFFHGWLAPLEVAAFTAASNVDDRIAASASPADDKLALSKLALVVIDQARFDGLYAGTSPLDRCQLAADLKHLRASFKTVAVDLDLSPTRRREQATCQAALDDVLDALGSRALLINPIGGADDRAWMTLRADKGVRFGAADLDLRYGMVRSYTGGSTRESHFAEVLGARLIDPGAAPPAAVDCERSAEPGPTAMATVTPARHGPCESHPVIFSARKWLHARGEPVPIDSDCVVEGGADGACTAVEHVLVGGSYGSEDEFITPVGRRPGMEVHAAIAAQPRQAEHPLLALAVDVVVGVLFGWLLHSFWSRYHRQRLRLPLEGGGSAGDPRLAYRWLFALAFAFLCIVLLLAFGITLLFSSSGLWISPAAMAVGMAVDGFVLGGVESANHLLGKFRQTIDELPQEPAAPALPTPGRTTAVAAALPCAVGLGIIAWTLFNLLRH